jgi:hypothetical protein
LGGLISPPPDLLSAPSTGVVTKEINVAATHQVQPRTHQPNRSVPEVMRFPGGSRWHAAFAEHCSCDRAIGPTVEARVERAQNERKSPVLWQRETVRRAVERSPSDGLPQAKRSVSAGGEVVIERDDGRGARWSWRRR